MSESRDIKRTVLTDGERRLIRLALDIVAGGYKVETVATIADRRSMGDLVRRKFSKTEEGL